MSSASPGQEFWIIEESRQTAFLHALGFSSCLQVPSLSPCPDFPLRWKDLRVVILNSFFPKLFLVMVLIDTLTKTGSLLWPLLTSPASLLCISSTAGSGSLDSTRLEVAPVVMPLTPMATREKIRSRFHGSHDLIHRLFVCISGMRSGPRTCVWGQAGRASGEKEQWGWPSLSRLKQRAVWFVEQT